METGNSLTTAREPWNKGKLVGQKTPFKLKEIWAIRIRLQMASRRRELALFNLAIDSKLRACDLVQLRVRDVRHGQIMASRALVLQQKTHRPVQFEITEPTREAVSAWIAASHLQPDDFLFPSRIRSSKHLSTRQYLKWPNRPKSKPLGAGRRLSVADRPTQDSCQAELPATKLPLVASGRPVSLLGRGERLYPLQKKCVNPVQFGRGGFVSRAGRQIKFLAWRTDVVEVSPCHVRQCMKVLSALDDEDRYFEFCTQGRQA
jgi:hypothetical protein